MKKKVYNVILKPKTKFMNTKQENKFNMYLAVKAFLLSKIGELKGLPNFMTFLNEFQDYISKIQITLERQALDESGVAKTKTALKLKLALLAADNTRRIYAYALFINDRVLSTEMQISQSKLEIKSDENLTRFAEAIFSRAKSHLIDLAPYGITADTLDVFRSAIDDFTGSMSNPRINNTESKLNTQQMAGYFTGVEKSLEQIDALIDILRNAQPDIFNAYIQSRKTIDYGTRTIAVRGIIIDAITKIGLKGVVLAFMNADEKNTAVKLVKKTAAKGGFNIKSLAEGIYRIKISKVGYVDQVITVTVNKGELCKIKMEMIRI